MGAQNFINICDDSSGNKCCAEKGMANVEGIPNLYWIMTYPRPWYDLDTQCRLEEGRLVVLESRREQDCMVKYIIDEYKGDPARSYAIGLKTPDGYKGVYEWSHVDNTDPNFDAATPAFENWAPGYPKGNPCVVMSIGSEATISGLWNDGNCESTNLYGICEKVK